MTAQELNTQINEQLKLALTKASEIIKKYVDERDSVTNEALKKEILDQISNIDGLSDKIAQLEKLADTFTKFFDANEDGEITPEELAGKFALLQTNIEELSKRLDGYDSQFKSLDEAINKVKEDLTAEINALKVNVAKNQEDLVALKNNVETNYVTKESLTIALSVGVDALVKAVNEVFFPSTNDNGDGATL